LSRVLTVFGTRPEAIKLAPVIRALRERGCETLVCVSAQHRDMLDPILEVFGIVPEFDLNVMRDNQTPLEVASRIFQGLVPLLERVKPDWLLVQGDTTTTFAAAWVGFHQRTRIAHVEAGLRTRDKFRPFPEEMNRRLTGALADLHFAATPLAVENLREEGVPAEQIALTGNPVVDALQFILSQPATFSDPRLNQVDGKVVLVTAHRRESFGEPLERICAAICELVQQHPEITVVYPVHRNPAVSSAVYGLLGRRARIVLLDPLPYPDFVHLMKRASLILTDSGGIQEEAPTVGTPALVLREVTERPEAIESGWAELVGTSPEKILERANAWLATDGRSLPSSENPFGDGKASQRIAALLQQIGNPQAV
jgi:UDP-N-acetylglucosamine 2-epimerase (non-hydrolysing)